MSDFKIEAGFATIDELEPFPCYYVKPRDKWNGWACPMFTASVLAHVKQYILDGVIMPEEREELEQDLIDATYTFKLNGFDQELHELVGYCFEECDEKGNEL